MSLTEYPAHTRALHQARAELNMAHASVSVFVPGPGVVEDDIEDVKRRILILSDKLKWIINEAESG